MKALAIKQPWASLIVMGVKLVENRTWRTSYRGPVLIHASKAKDDAEMEAMLELKEERGLSWETPPGEEMSTWGNCPAGGIIGRAEIVDCVTESDDPFFVGPFGFVLANVSPLPFMPARGALGFFEVCYPEGGLES